MPTRAQCSLFFEVILCTTEEPGRLPHARQLVLHTKVASVTPESKDNQALLAGGASYEDWPHTTHYQGTHSAFKQA